MSNPKRDFQGIWIPAEIWLSENLTLQEKVFLVEIQSLDGEEGCFATNDYFAKFFGVSKVRVSEVIRSLIAKKLIVSTVDQAAGNRRTLRTLLKKPLIPSQSKVNEGIKGKHGRVAKESLTPVIGINNTGNNTPNNAGECAPTFEDFWNAYGHKVGSKPKTLQYWKKLKPEEQTAVMRAVKNYVALTVCNDTDRAGEFKPMRKYPEGFLGSRMWESYLESRPATSSTSTTSAPDPWAHLKVYGSYGK